MSKKVDVIKAFKKLPYEAQQQIETILDDDNLKLENVEIDYLIDDVKWTIKRMEMDMGDADYGGEEYNFALKTKKECEKWMKYYSKYIK